MTAIDMLIEVVDVRPSEAEPLFNRLAAELANRYEAEDGTVSLRPELVLQPATAFLLGRCQDKQSFVMATGRI